MTVATKWQYRAIRGERPMDELDDLGAEGWELVSVVAHQDDLQYFFKRVAATADLTASFGNLMAGRAARA